MTTFTGSCHPAVIAFVESDDADITPNLPNSSPTAVIEYKIMIHGVRGLNLGPEPDSLWGTIAADVKALPDAKDIWVYKKPDGIGGIDNLTGGGEHWLLWKEIVAVSIPVVCATGAYLGKKALDVLSDIVKAKLLAKGQDVQIIEIYGPNGEVVKRFTRK